MQGGMPQMPPQMQQQMQPQMAQQQMQHQAYMPPSGAQAPYQNGSVPMSGMSLGQMSSPAGGGSSAFSFIGGGSPALAPVSQAPANDLAFSFVADEMKGAGAVS